MIKFAAGFVLGIVTTFFWIYLILSSFAESMQTQSPPPVRQQNDGTIEVEDDCIGCRGSTLQGI